MISQNDAEIIKAFNSVTKKNKIRSNLLPSNIFYKQNWHGYAKCKGSYYVRSAIAGIVQMANFDDTKEWFEKIDYIKSIGLMYIVYKDDDNKYHSGAMSFRPLVYRSEFHSPPNDQTLNGFQYGIDEYVFNHWFTEDYIKKMNGKNFYFKDTFTFDVMPVNFFTDRVNIYKKVFLLLYFYLINKKNIKEGIMQKEMFEQIENLRYKTQFSNENEKLILDFLLTIYPSKYFYPPTLFGRNDNDNLEIENLINYRNRDEIYSQEN